MRIWSYTYKNSRPTDVDPHYRQDDDYVNITQFADGVGYHMVSDNLSGIDPEDCPANWLAV